MALTTVKKHTFEDFKSNQKAPFFELTDLAVNTYCIANKSEVCEHFKVYWIADGSGTYQIDFQEFSIEGSGIFCLSPKQVFTVKSEKVKTAYQIAFDQDFYCIETHGKEIACNGLLFNNVHRATAVSVGEHDKKKFQGFIDLMIAEIESKGDAHKDMLESYLRMFLIQTLRLVDKQELKISEISHSKDRTVQEFIALVDKHFKEEHTVSGYAEKLFITPKSLAKKLNALNYPTPLQVIKNRIILDAKRQLKFTNDTIKEIAFDLGFEDPAYFSRLFSKAAGVSPAAYRG